MARDAQLLQERREQGAVAGQLALGAQHVGARDAAGLERDPHQLQVVLVRGRRCRSPP
jgi:predicted RNA methylase